ncbi:MAG TPA: UDP-N-acetylmuramoyl-L-alanyl-D-glutamate--2,6-diaminopimelate ligase [Chloroflexota bacterium]|nr:UDP-N-acetylmuramoyl-L-alanyl-D-glutamate--2,6-diaminopimelate ligase [Chloroflexota bacterium]
MLSELLCETHVLEVIGDSAVELTGITTDSRQVLPGQVFVACPGQHVDGRQFISRAVEAGAVAVVCEPPGPSALGVPLILVPNARRALAELATAFYQHPSEHLGLIGVTGTDGKTTTTHLVTAILRAAGFRSGLISTVALDRGHKAEPNPTSHTTPDAPIIQENLARMRKAGIQIAALEVSSHALELGRVIGCNFDCAVFTNLDPEHLDFHGSLTNYRAAKAKLFAQLDHGKAKPWGRLAVVNVDDPSSQAMRSACSVPWIGFGFGENATIRGTILRANLASTTFRVDTPEDHRTIETRLAGQYNVANWLGAIAAARHFGATLEDAERAAAEFTGVPGRLEPVRCGQPFNVFVDFAHTPQGLAATLTLLRQQTYGRLIVLFGQAGHRDLRNRDRMAAAVAAAADLVIITSDDPYDEDPQQIVNDLARSFRQRGWRENREFWRIVDRRAAIEFSISLAHRGDCVLLAGRGAETVTTIQDQVIPLVDADVAHATLLREKSHAQSA